MNEKQDRTVMMVDGQKNAYQHAHQSKFESNWMNPKPKRFKEDEFSKNKHEEDPQKIEQEILKMW